MNTLLAMHLPAGHLDYVPRMLRQRQRKALTEALERECRGDLPGEQEAWREVRSCERAMEFLGACR